MSKSEIAIMRLELQRAVVDLLEKDAIIQRERGSQKQVAGDHSRGDRGDGGDESRDGRSEKKSGLLREDGDGGDESRDGRYEKKVAYYESANMPTSTPSLFNDERKKFRDARKKEATTSAGSTNGGEKKEDTSAAAPAKKRESSNGAQGRLTSQQIHSAPQTLLVKV